MKNNKKILFTIFFLSLFAVSCNDFLDELPDNRTEVDNQNKIRKLLVSAYPSTGEDVVAEMSSDNFQDLGDTNPDWERVHKQMVYWEDVTETDNDGPDSVWEGCYGAIAAANQALEGINSVGDVDFSAERGEALITRAYAHFILVNVFSKHYNEQTSDSDLGIPYLEAPEISLNPQYERGTVKDVYEKINKDIEEALPLIRDDIYDVPKYHFTSKAAYAFAARFNLYYQNWEKARTYASVVLTQNPLSVLRDWAAQGLVNRDQDPLTNAYINDNSSLLNVTSASNAGLIFGPYRVVTRFNHTRNIADTETMYAPLPFGNVSSANYNYRPSNYSASNFDKVVYFKMPYLFEYTDAVAKIGFRRTVYVPFTTDETLLVRAEANVMLKQYGDAINDLNTWTRNFFRNSETTVADVNTFYDGLAYSSEDVPNQKKTLAPKFTIEAGTQENMIHYTLQCRRILTIHEGLRWFDIKRYGITVPRYKSDLVGNISVVDVLKADDARKAIQLPKDVISAGLTPNPR
ncbi:RagB/SusD family nutrient uptake outer membrane protein [Polaribacter sp. Z014]|uniref:RagB/SusD family nutrient uptake outer membrane protein n=1 Tax=Polaribacter sp. Z014 TaxID=2927126 RepID=UPI00201FDBD0|nr:RagB/SusD family nutrient uptake outer membrane protein [Polaribacter sp. Z014]MCL7761820.1 RagB/SusD family nutrient uptake outer membrane protein [Polaribacter sp. Z014]